MKKHLFLALAVLSLSLNVKADDFRAPFLDESLTSSPDYVSWIHEPPSFTGGDFADDFYYYQWGLVQRTITGVSEMAIYDESAPLIDVFSSVIGIQLSPETTPEIVKLCERATTDAQKANYTVKNKYQRIRPFATFKDDSLTPESDAEEASTFSYPSGHSSRGYMFALVLSNLDPTLTSALMERADSYATNRVICGHHWKSDTNASLLLTAGIFAMVVSTEAYQEQLKKARAEYERIKGSTRVSAPKASTATSTAAIYDMQGRQLNAEPNRRLYIHNGQKYIRK